MHSSGLEQGQVARSCAYDNHLSRYINKMFGISLQAEEPLASQEGLCSMNFVTEMRHPIPETSTKPGC